MKKVDTNTVVALAALMTSVVAVFIAWDEGRLQRQNQRASFLPLIDLEGSVGTNDGSASLAVSLTNRGHGVAFLKSFEIFHDGQPVTGWAQLEASLLTEELARSADLSWADPEGFFQARDREVLLRLTWPEEMLPAFSDQFFVRAEDTIATFDAKACYCSVFGECWTTTMLGDIEPLEVQNCPDKTNVMDSLWSGFVEFQTRAATND